MILLDKVLLICIIVNIIGSISETKMKILRLFAIMGWFCALLFALLVIVK